MTVAVDSWDAVAGCSFVGETDGPRLFANHWRRRREVDVDADVVLVAFVFWASVVLGLIFVLIYSGDRPSTVT